MMVGGSILILGTAASEAPSVEGEYGPANLSGEWPAD